MTTPTKSHNFDKVYIASDLEVLQKAIEINSEFKPAVRFAKKPLIILKNKAMFEI
jgi:hypothetical protein